MHLQLPVDRSRITAKRRSRSFGSVAVIPTLVLDIGVLDFRSVHNLRIHPARHQLRPLLRHHTSATLPHASHPTPSHRTAGGVVVDQRSDRRSAVIPAAAGRLQVRVGPVHLRLGEPSNPGSRLRLRLPLDLFRSSVGVHVRLLREHLPSRPAHVGASQTKFGRRRASARRRGDDRRGLGRRVLGSSPEQRFSTALRQRSTPTPTPTPTDRAAQFGFRFGARPAHASQGRPEGRRHRNDCDVDVYRLLVAGVRFDCLRGLARSPTTLRRLALPWQRRRVDGVRRMRVEPVRLRVPFAGYRQGVSAIVGLPDQERFGG